MAEPARKPDADIDPDIRPDLRAIPGGGESTSGRGNLRLVKDLEENPDTPATDGSTPEEDEANPKSNVIKGPWDDKTTDNKEGLNVPLAQKALALAKKRGGIFGIIGLLGLGGGIMAGFFGPASMVINLLENFTSMNDTSSFNLERRFMKAFGFATADTDPVCKYSSKVKCNMGRISNSGLYRLNKKGIVPYFDTNNGNKTTYDGKRTGYPARNPTGYIIDLDDGVGARSIPAADLPGFLAAHPKAAAKILGQAGAINLRVKVWSGKHITNKFYKKFNLNRNGGVAAGSSTGSNPEEHRRSVMDKFRERVAGIGSNISNATNGLQSKIEGRLGGARKGGAGYTIAVAGCIGVKAIPYATSAYAAIQLAQILPFAMEFVLSPGSLAKSTAVGAPFDADDAELIGTAFTERVPNQDGKLTSALDSPILLSQMGANRGTPAVSPRFTPGYSLLSNSTVRAAAGVDEALEPACNTILSPAAMYSALAVDSAVTVAASATVVGGIAKIVIGAAVGIVAEQIVTNAVMGIAKTALTDLATNDAIPSARGEAFGDIVGVSISAFFAGGGMANNLPTLTQSDLSENALAQAENNAFHRDMDIATLSPFDTSSRYTFLGSIVNNLQMGVILNSNYTGSISSIFSSLFNSSTLSIDPYAGATPDLSMERCKYADAFYLGTGNPNTTPAVTVSGLPCTGYTEEQAAMPTSEAIDLISSEGWLDENVEIEPDDSIDELRSKGYIKAETPLTDTMDACGDASTGDYIFNTAGCTVVAETKNSDDPRFNTCAEDDDGETVCAAESEEWEDVEAPEGVQNAKSMSAIAVFLGDYQLRQIISGHDDTASQALKDETTFNDEVEQETGAVVQPEAPITFPTPQLKVDTLAEWLSQRYDRIGYSRLLHGMMA